MSKSKIVVLIITFFVCALNAQDMRQNAYNSLFSDFKANRIGDAVTIIVIESSQAVNQAATQAGRSSDIGFGTSASMDGDAAIPTVDFDMGSNNDFKGSGSTKSSGSVRTKISATIDSVFQNGNLRIAGSRKITINGEEQLVKISGVVRSIDIQSDNTVYSYNISDAEIAFEGSGMIDNNQSPGWLTKLFHWLF